MTTEHTSSTYDWRPIAAEDIEAWAALANHLAQVDGTEEFHSVQDLTETFEMPAFDARRDSVSVWDGEQMIACGQVFVADNPDADGRIRCGLGGGVHADYRGQGIGRELMDRLEARADEAAAAKHPGIDWFWRSQPGLEGCGGQQLLQARGYEVARYFNVLSRPLPGDALDYPAPDGVMLRAPEPGDGEAVRQAHNAAFADHWGSSAHSPETWNSYWTASSGRPDMSTIAVDDDGQVLGYVLTGQWVEGELYVNIVGTVPSARGRGLARATLAHTIRAASEAGEHRVIELDVDSDSLTGATRLYDALGFGHKHTTVAMQRDPA